jgi:hypothetical protein
MLEIANVVGVNDEKGKRKKEGEKIWRGRERGKLRERIWR